MSTGLPLLPNFLSRFIEHWASKRLPQADRQTILARQRIYILPTRSGLTFFIILLVILLGAINYENSLAFMLSFLFGSIGFLGMIHTHQNLNHLQIAVLPARPVFTGQTAQFPLVLGDRNRHAHLNIKFQCGNQSVSSGSLSDGDDESHLTVNVSAPRRGRLTLPKIKVFTEFPLGLFHAWSWVELTGSCIVYPAPDDHPPHYPMRGRHDGTVTTQLAGHDDFAGIRDYQKGDAPGHLAWKAVARTGELQTKLFNAEAGNEIWLSWFQLPDTMDVEKRLSVLCRWVLDADAHGLSYGLEIPGDRRSPASGLHHRQACLQSLALFGTTETP